MKDLKKDVIINIWIAAALLLFGVLLASLPNFTITMVIALISIAFIVFGIIEIISFLRINQKTGMFENNLLLGIVGIVLGILILIFGKTVISLFRIAIAIWIIYMAINKFAIIKMFKSADFTSWKYMTLFSIIMLVFGVYLLFNSGAIISTIGVIIIVYAILDLVDNILMLKNISKIIIN